MMSTLNPFISGPGFNAEAQADLIRKDRALAKAAAIAAGFSPEDADRMMILARQKARESGVAVEPPPEPEPIVGGIEKEGKAASEPPRMKDEAVAMILRELKGLREEVAKLRSAVPEQVPPVMTLAEVAHLCRRSVKTVSAWANDREHWLSGCRVRGSAGLFEGFKVYENFGVRRAGRF